MPRKLNVAVIFGGQSGEHEISLTSAASVMQALDSNKYNVTPVGITREGRWLTSGDVIKRLRSASRSGLLPPEASPKPAESKELYLLPMESVQDNPGPGAIDIAFPVLHGPYGEDGTVQGLLELAGIPYVGAGVLASAVGMDKEKMKVLFAHKNLPMVKYTSFIRRDWEADANRIMDGIEAETGYPVFVKPCNLGSSVGISKAEDRRQLKRSINLACSYDRKIIVEEGLDCREVECSVLGNEEPQASLAGEIVPKREFYDYEAKYTEGLADIIIPAPIDETLMRGARKIALEAFKAIDCCGMARVDLFLEKNSNKLYLSEINTIPGFTSTSVYARLWEATGIGYSQLLDRLIELALERHRDKVRSLAPILERPSP